MNWTFTPQITGLTTYRFPYDPVDARELTKFEDIMADGIEQFLYREAFTNLRNAMNIVADYGFAIDLGLIK